jgi:hypothetical protein
VNRTGAKTYLPLPHSLTHAATLLKEHAHVNLRDYFEAHRKGGSDYSGLLFPTRKALIAYTKETGKYVDKESAKKEWLQPLLKDFSARGKRR